LTMSSIDGTHLPHYSRQAEPVVFRHGIAKPERDNSVDVNELQTLFSRANAGLRSCNTGSRNKHPHYSSQTIPEIEQVARSIYGLQREVAEVNPSKQNPQSNIMRKEVRFTTGPHATKSPTSHYQISFTAKRRDFGGSAATLAPPASSHFFPSSS
jgi:hypothetical protein